MAMKRSYTDDELRVAISSSLTWSDVGRKLGNVTKARHAKAIADKLSIDYSHFIGQSHRRGMIRDDLLFLEKAATERKKRTGSVKLSLIRSGLKKAECERCKRTEWEGEPIPLSLDHVDGDNLNNQLDNLRILCENCHALTPTWRGRNKKKQA